MGSSQSIAFSCTRARAVAVHTSDASTNDLEVFIIFFCGKVSQSEINILRTIQVSTQRHVLNKSTSIEYVFATNQTGK